MILLRGSFRPRIGDDFSPWFGIAGSSLAALAVSLFVAYRRVMRQGAEPFPTAPEPDLPSVLKTLYLQQAATRFAIGVSDNLIGPLIGVPTTSKAACQALDALLALAGAVAAARADDDAGVAAHVFEALRFAPVNPVIYRWALRQTVIARSNLRACTIPEGTMMFAANFPAMFAPLAIDAPDAFRTDRPTSLATASPSPTWLSPTRSAPWSCPPLRRSAPDLR